MKLLELKPFTVKGKAKAKVKTKALKAAPVKLKLLTAAGNRHDDSPEREDLRRDVWKMITLLREAKGGGMAEEFAKRLRFLNDHRAEIEKGIIVWIHLIELFVQGAERAHGDGQGKIKKAQVKSALFRILNDPKAAIPNVPRYLQPLIVDVLIDWLIEGIVQAANDYCLWESSDREESAWSFRSFLIWLKHITEAIWCPVVEGLIRVYTTAKYSEPLSPELQAAVDAVIRDGIIEDKNAFLRSLLDFVVFIGNHPRQAIAGIQLVFEAVHMAESFLDLTGPEKKHRARELIIATLEDLGVPVSGLIGIFIEFFIDSAIESAVSVFNMRAPETFHRRTA